MTTSRAQVMEQIRAEGIIPAIRVKTPDQVLCAIRALYEAGVQVAEVAMSMSDAMSSLESSASEFGDRMLIGAGTVLDAKTAKACILAGAQFIVSPGLDLPTIETCRHHGVPVFPGALSPTEIIRAWSAGADCVKVFPVSAVGGPAYLRAIKAPLPHVQLLPMGGVSLEMAVEYLTAGAFALGVANDLVKFDGDELDAAPIIARARQYRALITQGKGLPEEEMAPTAT